MFTMEIFVKLRSIKVMDALVSDMLTSITSGSGLAHTRLGTLLNQAREWALGVW